MKGEVLMGKRRHCAALALAAVLACACSSPVAGQTRGRTAASAAATASSREADARLSGVYRIDPERSDKLYSVVAGASSTLPYAEQQKFFIDLAVRLTPPDQLAIERKGRRVQIASSRAPRITFEADGVARRERSSNGRFATTRAAIEDERLTVGVGGGTDDRFNVTFAPLDGGRTLRVTRRITAPQLSEPIVITSVYEKISADARWNVYGEPQIATDERRPPANAARANPQPDGARPSGARTSDARAASASTPAAAAADANMGGWAVALRAALEEWIRATNERDIARQMEFYAPTLEAFYLARSVPRSSVRAEKQRVFEHTSTVDVRADSPEIVLADAGRTAVMRFRKEYEIEGGGRGSRRGAVIQELRWRRTDAGWKITSERDVRVLR